MDATITQKQQKKMEAAKKLMEESRELDVEEKLKEKLALGEIRIEDATSLNIITKYVNKSYSKKSAINRVVDMLHSLELDAVDHDVAEQVVKEVQKEVQFKDIEEKLDKECRMRRLRVKDDQTITKMGLYIVGFKGSKERKDAMCSLLNELEKVKFSILDVDIVDRVVKLLSIAKDAQELISEHSSPVEVINIFGIPKYKFGIEEIKKWSESLPILGQPSARSEMYKDRFLLLHHRFSRFLEAFRQPLKSEPSENIEISSIDSLFGEKGQKGRRWIMGIIFKKEDGHLFLEDLTHLVEISISEAKISNGFITESSIIVAQGDMLNDGIFQISELGFPSLERREETVQFCQGLNIFGGTTFTKEQLEMLMKAEKNAFDDRFVILSDIWLDKKEAIKSLDTVLDQFEIMDVPPSLFILMGDFWSQPWSVEFKCLSSLRSHFGKLGKMIASHTRLRSCRYLFLPGPGDPGSKVLPRSGFPKSLTEELQKYLPQAIFGTNPCRLTCPSQQIVLFRKDLLDDMRQSSLVSPISDDKHDDFDHLVTTVTHQSHLCPLPLTQQAILLNYDHCLQIYPTPDVIGLGDRSPVKASKYRGVLCFNTGSFSVDKTFVIYHPGSREVELLSLD